VDTIFVEKYFTTGPKNSTKKNGFLKGAVF
jgi:hypothetical protein